jgi:primosomal protein N' (replication factor Y)
VQELFKPTTAENLYVTVILPLALPKEYTYAVPLEFKDAVKPGVRVEVQFGKNKLYSALVFNVINEKPESYTPKPIINVLDKEPIVTKKQFDFWRWMATYYCCTVGEVMNAALPSGLKLVSETKLILSPTFDGDFTELNDKEYLIAEALTIQNELTIEEVRKIVNLKSVYHLIDVLLDKKVIYLEAELKQKYKVKTVDCIRLAEPYFSKNELLRAAFQEISRAGKQTEALMAFIQLSKTETEITRKKLVD